MKSKFCQDSDLINNLKAKKGIQPILVKGICPIRSLAENQISYSIGVYYKDSLDEKLTELLLLWLDFEQDLLTQAEELIRLTRKGKKQSKVGISINSFVS